MEENNFWIHSIHLEVFINFINEIFFINENLDTIRYNIFQTNNDENIWYKIFPSNSLHKIEASKDNNEIIFFKIITTKDKMDSIQFFLSEIEKE